MYFYFSFSTSTLFELVDKATFLMFVFHLIFVLFQVMKMIFSSFRFITSNSTDQCVWFCVLIRSSYEAAQEWALPVQFCHLHALPLSPAFPQDCARDGQWLNFLLFVQLHNYPLQQVCLLHDSVL